MTRKEEFLHSLEQLYEEYGMAVEACGCCDSPWVMDADADSIKETIAHLREYL